MRIAAAPRQVEGGGTLNYRMKIRVAGYLFITPLVIGFSLFVILPLIFAVGVSFREWNGLQSLFSTKFVGFNNYAKLFSDPQFLNALLNTCKFVVGMVLGQSLLGLILALALNNVTRGLGLLRSLFFLPSILSAIAMSLLWKSVMYTPSYGAINLILKAFGFSSQPFLQSMDQAMSCIIWMTIWKYAGHYMILFITGLKNIQTDFYESARIDGANKFQEFLKITLPLLKPTILLVLVMNAIGSFQVFGPVFMMTMGGPGRATESVVTLMYNTAFSYSKFSYAVAMAMILFVIIMLITLLQMSLMREGGLEEY
jgi:multiple sugar transport system permease protein